MDARFSLDAQHQVIVQFYPLRQGKRNANKDRIAKTLKNNQYVLAINLPFQAQFESIAVTSKHKLQPWPPIVSTGTTYIHHILEN